MNTLSRISLSFCLLAFSQVALSHHYDQQSSSNEDAYYEPSQPLTNCSNQMGKAINWGDDNWDNDEWETRNNRKRRYKPLMGAALSEYQW